MTFRDLLLTDDVEKLIGVGSWEWNVTTDVVTLSSHTREIFEVKPTAEVAVADMQRLRSTLDASVGQDILREALRTGKPWDIEHAATTALGKPIWLRSTGRVERAGGRTLRIYGIVQDRTQDKQARSALQRSEELLAEISALAGIGGWEYDVATGRVAWSDEARRIHEVAADFDPTPEAIRALFAPGALEAQDASIRLAAENGTPSIAEYDALTAGKRKIRVRSVSRVEKTNGEISRLVGTVQDITRETEAAAALTRSEKLLADVSALSKIGGWEFDLRSSSASWSLQTRNIYEVEESFDPSGDDHERFVAPEWRQTVTSALQDSIIHGSPTDVEFEAITGKGRRIWARNICNAERVNGRTVRLFGTVQDVSIQKAATAQIVALNARLAAAVDAVELRIWEIDAKTGDLVWDPRAPPTFANAAMHDRIGAPAALDLVHSEDRAEFKRLTRLLTLGDQPVASRLRVYAPDGGIRHVDVRMRLAPDFGTTPKILGISRDITYEVEANEELQVKRQEAEAASIAKGEFVARMSHEIRTPMTGVIGMLEVLLRSGLNPEQSEHAKTALQSARDLMYLLDDIIDVSRLESRHMSIDASPFQVRELIGDAAALFQTGAREKMLALSADVDPGVPEWLVADRRRIRQVLANLIGNALKFTDSGSIAISVAYDGVPQMLRIAVRDTGTGLAQDAVDKLFQPFFQVDSSTTRRQSGAGLGLAICRQLVELMNGQISADSRPGEGSTFSFAVNAPIGVGPGREAPELMEVAMRPLHMLIAEDNLPTQKILRALLTPAGHELTFAGDGQIAVELASNEHFDVILMDVMMPGIDGPTATRRIRALGGHAGNVPIIALTANAQSGDRDRYLAAGMTDYLTKPIDVAALFAALARAKADA